MPDTAAPRPDPSQPAAVPAPPSVRYAQAVLFLQGSIWATGAIGGVIGAAVALTGIPHGKPWAVVVLAVCWSAFAGGMAAAKTLLAVRLGRSRSRRARRAVITVELAMTCFGVLWFIGEAYTATGLPADMFALAGLVGAGLSLVAALVLMRRRAREYAAANAARPVVTGPGPASGPTSFWRQAALARG